MIRAATEMVIGYGFLFGVSFLVWGFHGAFQNEPYWVALIFTSALHGFTSPIFEAAWRAFERRARQ